MSRIMSETVYTVSQINQIARGLLESRLSDVQIEGEISTFARPGSGHWYFTLKDESAQIRCAMFRNRNYLVNFQPAQGDQVLVTGKVSLFEARGEYQLIVETMQAAGIGQLLVAFEKLKQRLQAEGLFDAAHKQELPAFPHRIGLITSPTGAAIHDMRKVLARRYPLAELWVYPVQVQGDQAAEQIARAIERANQAQQVDVLIVGRGGGSIEDLWAFNEEVVARAIYASDLPVISAVGHETDFTIADFVADLRAPTPSAAAEVVAPHQDELRGRIFQAKERLTTLLQASVKEKKQSLTQLEHRLATQHPTSRMAQQRLRIDHLLDRLQSSQNRLLRNRQMQLIQLRHRLQNQNPEPVLLQWRSHVQAQTQRIETGLQNKLTQHRARLDQLSATLQAISPERTLERGYSITLNQKGKAITSCSQVESGDIITTQVKDGRFRSTINDE